MILQTKTSIEHLDSPSDVRQCGEEHVLMRGQNTAKADIVVMIFSTASLHSSPPSGTAKGELAATPRSDASFLMNTRHALDHII